MLYEEVSLLRMRDIRKYTFERYAPDTPDYRREHIDEMLAKNIIRKGDDVTYYRVHPAYISEYTHQEVSAVTTCYARRPMTDTIGRVLKIEAGSTYLYDGESTYWHRATVINDDGSPRFVRFGGTKGRDSRDVHYDLGSTVDITDDLRAKYEAWKIADDARKEQEHKDRQRQEYIATLYIPRRGVDCILTKGRPKFKDDGTKVPLSTTGTVFWVGDNGWGPAVGVETRNGRKFFTASTNIDVVPFANE